MTIQAASLVAEVGVDGVDDARGALVAFGRSVDDAAGRQGDAARRSREHEQALREASTGALVMGGAMVAGFGLAAGAAMNFDSEMSAVGAASNATAEDLDRLRQAALDAGRDTAFSATEAAAAETELAKAGLSTADILDGALRGALDLAAAGQMDVAAAAEISATALSVFQLEGEQAGHVADLLAAGAGKAQGEVVDMAAALNQSALVAKQAGLSIEDTTGTLALFAKNGLLGSDAGTSLKTMLQRLVPTSEDAAATMRDLGIEFFDANGEFVGITEVADELRSGLRSLSDEQRLQALTTMFGADAIRAASILYESGAEGVQEWIDATNDAGFASETAAAKLDNLAGDLEALRGSIETALIEGGSEATGALRGMTQGATDLVNWFSALPDPVQATGVALVGVTGTGLLLAGTIGSLVPKVQAFTGALQTLALRAPRTATALGGLTRVGIGFGVFMGVRSILASVTDEARLTDDQIRELSLSVRDLGTEGQIAGILADKYGDDLSKLAEDVERVNDSILDANAFDKGAEMFERFGSALLGADSEAEDARDRIDDLDQALASLVAQSAPAAERAFSRIKSQLEAEGVAAAVVEEIFDDYKLALDETRASTDDTEAATRRLSGSLNVTEQTAEDVDKRLDDLRETLDSVFGVHLDVEAATLDWQNSLAELRDTLEENNGSLDLYTQAGRDNRQAILGATDSALGLAEALITEQGNIDAASLLLAGHVQSLADTARAAGMSEDAILDYAASVLGVPPEARTEITNTADLAQYVVDTYRTNALGQIPAEVRTTITADTSEAEAAIRRYWQTINNLTRNHSFGELFGSGSIPGAASGGRFAAGQTITVGEQGWELLRTLPGGGVEVLSNPQSRRVLTAGDDHGPPQHVVQHNYHAPIYTQSAAEFADEVDRRERRRALLAGL